MGHSRPLFSFIFVFSMQMTVGKCSINFCRWLDSNRGSLDIVIDSLPTEPQPLPNISHCFIDFDGECFHKMSFFLKWAILGLCFVYFWPFSNKQYKFYSKLMWKMSIQYPAPGFELTAFWLCIKSKLKIQK